jgi:hypothetical protein
MIMLVLQLPFLLVFVSGNRATSVRNWKIPVSIAWSIIFAILSSLNILVLVKIVALKRSQTLNDRAPIRELLARMQVTAMLLTVSSLGVFVTLGILTVTAVRGYYDDPRCYLDSAFVAVRTARIFLIFAAGVCLWFVSLPVATARQKAECGRRSKIKSMTIAVRNPEDGPKI